MKKQRIIPTERQKRAIRIRFWTKCFPVAAPFIEMVITNNGTVQWNQLEIAARYTIEDRDVMSRKTLFTKLIEFLLYIQSKFPHSLELGAVYPAGYEQRKDQRKMSHLINLGGPVVLDIDIDDYHREGLRQGLCDCDKKQVCKVCWNVLLEPGRAVLDMMLRQTFGLCKIFYVFSGRRGYHAWIVDDKVWKWTFEQRSSFVTQLTKRPRGGCLITNQIVGILEPIWRRELFNNPNGSVKQKMANMRRSMPEEEYAEMVRQSIWNDLFPKIDIPVTKDAAHLKKIFLSPHLKTGKITIPLELPSLSTNEVEGHKFDPLLHVPTMESVDVYMMEQYVQQIQNALNKNQE